MKVLFGLVSGFVIFNLVGCGGTVGSNSAARDYTTGKVKIKRDYNFVFDQQAGQALFTATFREHKLFGDRIVLEYPSFLEVNGEVISNSGFDDEPDGGELMAFFAGFLFPPFWILAGDNSYPEYNKTYREGTRSFQVEFTDPEGETFTDHIYIPFIAYQAPSHIRAGQDIDISMQGASDYQSVNCTIQFYVRELQTITQCSDSGECEEREEWQTVSSIRSFSVTNERLTIPYQEFSSALEPEIGFGCEARSILDLSGKAIGQISISNKLGDHVIQVSN